jgi:hypothetical protein
LADDPPLARHVAIKKLNTFFVTFNKIRLLWLQKKNIKASGVFIRII